MSGRPSLFMSAMSAPIEAALILRMVFESAISEKVPS